MEFNISWEAPERFHLFGTDWSHPDWISAVIAGTPLEPAHEPEGRELLTEFARWVEQQSDPDDLHLWIAHVATAPNGQMMINVTGSISFGPAVDVDEVAEEWRAAQAESTAVVAEVEVSPSRRAPVVAAREIYLVPTEDGEQRYHEWGLAVRSLPRLDMSVRMEIDTPDLAAFENLTEFLIDSIRNVSLTEVEESA